MRIVSLLPAATEICYALGLGENVVGVSPECDHPAAARTKPIMSRALLPYDGQSSGETSRMVGERLAAGGGLYQVDAEALGSADPDLILTQGLCDVCAPTLGDVEDVARDLPRTPEIVSLDPHSLADVLADIVRVGRMCDMEAHAAEVVDGLRLRIEDVRGRASRTDDRPRTLCVEWLDPLFIAGHWVPEMVDLAGGVDVLGRSEEKYRRVTSDDIVEASPEAAVLMPCGFDLERTRTEAGMVTGARWWSLSPASKNRRKPFNRLLPYCLTKTSLARVKRS